MIEKSKFGMEENDYLDLNLFGVIINPLMDMLENFLNRVFKKVFGIWFSYINRLKRWNKGMWLWMNYVKNMKAYFIKCMMRH